MIISRTPLRISFCGGGTDLPDFYREQGGAVVATAITKYIYINVNRKFDDMIRASYSVTEIVDSLSDLKHELIREGMRLTGLTNGIEITSISDIPSSGTGLGSSSTYTVGLLNALYGYAGKHAGPERLAAEASKIEIDILGKPIGKQDQYAAAYGGLQFIQFNPDETVFVDPIMCDFRTKRRLSNRLMMMYTGMTRSADSILKEQKDNTASNEDKRLVLAKMRKQAEEMRDALNQNSLEDFGVLLHEGWCLKRGLASGISNTRIDDWYATARKHGAIGGKILGAGGGGFLLLFAEPEDQDDIARALPDLQRVPFGLEPQGSKIIFIEESAH